jgi:ABC-type phosphate transport system auxiliary subunit
MPVMDERMANLEGSVRQFPQMVSMLQSGLDALRGDLRAEVGALRNDLRTEVASVRSELVALRSEMYERLGALEKRLERLEERMATQFTWLVGLQITTLVAVVGVLLART